MKPKIRWLGYLVAIIMIAIVAINSNEIIVMIASAFTVLSLIWINVSGDAVIQKDLLNSLKNALDGGNEYEIRSAYKNLSMIGVGKDEADRRMGQNVSIGDWSCIDEVIDANWRVEK